MKTLAIWTLSLWGIGFFLGLITIAVWPLAIFSIPVNIGAFIVNLILVVRVLTQPELPPVKIAAVPLPQPPPEMPPPPDVQR